MASNVVRVSILADAKSLEQQLRGAGKEAQAFGDRMGLMGKAVVAAVAIKALSAVKDFVSGSVDAYKDLTESTNAVEKTFGDAAEAILDIGRNSAESFGLSKAEFNSFAVSMAGFAKNIAGEGGSIVEVTEKLIQRAADFASVHNIEVADALGIFQSTLAGQTEPIRRYGKDISDAAIKLFALETGIIDTKREMTEGEKQTARYGLLLRETEDWAGDFADTAGELANQQRIANAELEDAKAKLGEKLAPVVLEVTQLFRDFINVLGELLDLLPGVDVGIMDIVEAIVPFGQQIGWAKDRLGDWSDSIDENNEREAKAETLTKQWTRAHEAMRGELVEGRPPLQRHTEAVEDATDATEELAEETQTAADAIRDVQSAAREAVDPVFAYMQGTQELADAQAAYNAAVDEFGVNSPEAIQAAEDIARANGKIQEAVTDIGEVGVPAAMAALKSLGVPQAVIDKFAADKKRIEEIFRNMVLRIGVSAPTLYPTSPSSGGVGWKSESRNYYAHGGIAKARPGGVDVAAEAGSDEAMIPMNSEGIGILAAAMKEAIGGGGQAINLIVPASRSTAIDGWDIIEMLQKIEQSSGPLPIRVRQG
jgi:methyl-accepting chemotaxis protein